MAKRTGLNDSINSIKKTTSNKKSSNVVDILTKQIQEKRNSQLQETRPDTGRRMPTGTDTYIVNSYVNRGRDIGSKDAIGPLVNVKKNSDGGNADVLKKDTLAVDTALLKGKYTSSNAEKNYTFKNSSIESATKKEVKNTDLVEQLLTGKNKDLNTKYNQPIRNTASDKISIRSNDKINRLLNINGEKIADRKGNGITTAGDDLTLKGDYRKKPEPKKHAEGQALKISLRGNDNSLGNLGIRPNADESIGNGNTEIKESARQAQNGRNKFSLYRESSFGGDLGVKDEDYGGLYQGPTEKVKGATKLDYVRGYYGEQQERKRTGQLDPTTNQERLYGDYSLFSDIGLDESKQLWKGKMAHAEDVLEGRNEGDFSEILALGNGNATEEDVRAWREMYADEDPSQPWLIQSLVNTLNHDDNYYQNVTANMTENERTAYDNKVMDALLRTEFVMPYSNYEAIVDQGRKQIKEIERWEQANADYDEWMTTPRERLQMQHNDLTGQIREITNRMDGMSPDDPEYANLKKQQKELARQLTAVDKQLLNAPEDDPVFHPENDRSGEFGYGVHLHDENIHEIVSFVNGGREMDEYVDTYHLDGNNFDVKPAYRYAMMMSPEEIKKLNVYYNQDPAMAEQFMQNLKPVLMNRYSHIESIYNKQTALQLPVVTSITNRGINLLNSLGFQNLVTGVAAMSGNPDANNPDSPLYGITRFRQQTEEAIANKLGPVGGFVYRGFMNAADNVLRVVMSKGIGNALGIVSQGGQSALNLAMFFNQAVSEDFVNNLEETGGDIWRSAFCALVNGGIGTLFEVASIEHLMSDPKQLLDYIIKGIAAESSEELAEGLIGPDIEDILTGTNKWKDNSQRLFVEATENGGYIVDENNEIVRIENANDAYKYEWKTHAMPEILYGTALGGFAGGIGSGMNVIRTNANRVETGRSINTPISFPEAIVDKTIGEKYTSSAEALIKIGQGMNEDTESRKQADKLAKKVEDGKKLRSYETGKLAETIFVEGSRETADTAEQYYAESLQKEMTQRGMSEEQAKIAAELVAKAKVKGLDSLTRKERRQMMGNELAYQTYLELVQEGSENKEAREIAESITPEAPTVGNQFNKERKSILEQRKLKYLNEEVRAANALKTAKQATEQQLRTAIGNRTGTAADVVVGNRIGQVTGFKEEEGEILATVKFDDGTENVGLSEVYGADSNVAGLLKYAQVFKGAMTPEYLTAAVRTAQELGENINDKYLAEAERISLAAWFGESMPTVSMDKTAAENLYKIAQAEQQAAEDRRTQNPAQALNPGKGRSVFNGVEYGSKGWKAALNKLPENIRKNDINVLAELNRRLGFDLVFIHNPNDTDMFGYENGNTGRITVNLAAMNANEKGRSYLTIAGHEFTHWLQYNSKAGYAALRNFIIKSYRQEGKSVENMVLDKLASYQSGLKARADEETAERRKTDQNAEAVRPQRFVLEDAIYEVIAEASDQVLASDEMAKRLQAEDPNLYGKFKQFIKNFFSNLKQAIGYMRDSGSISRESAALMRAEIREGIAKHWLAAYDEAMGVERPSEFAAGEEGKINYSRAENGIESNMDDLERYHAVKGTQIEIEDASFINKEWLNNIVKLKNKNDIEKSILTVAKDAGLIRTREEGPISLENKYLNFNATFSKKSLHESIEKQSKGFGNIAALIPVLKETYKNAVPILIQGDRYTYTVYDDSNLDAFEYLLGAFKYNGNIVPVQFGLKVGENNSIYVVATIKEDALNIGSTDIHPSGLPTASSTISIEDIIKNVNQNDWSILVNIPSYFLDEAQKTGKRTGLKLKGNDIRNKANNKKDSSLPIRLTTERIDKEIKNFGSSSPNYSKAYLTSINPEDFINLTASDPKRIHNESRVMIAKEIREGQTPFLRFDQETGEITGHEGRHRLASMMNAGIKEVPVLLIPDGEKGRYEREVIDNLKLTGVDQRSAEVNNIIPVNEKHRQKLIDTYGEKSENWFSYSIRESDNTEITNSEGDVMAEQLPSGNITAYSLRTVNDTVDEELIRQLVAKGFGEKKVKKWVKDVFSVARYIADNRQRLDYQEGPGTMLKNNAEYVKTLDASTLCAKRLLYQGIFNEIQHMLPNTPLLPDDLIKLQNMMRKAGLVTPCSFCYVESRRKMLGVYAEKFIKSYEGAYKPKIEEVTTTDGLEALRTSEDPAKRQAYDDFVADMNAKGSANPKVVQLRTDYEGEIKNLTDKQIEKVKSIGGLRIQSFSDFEVVHMLDMMQAVMDMAAKDLTSQAYTKVPAFAWVFGDTGIKINLSLVGKGTGLDANGNLVFDNEEGMDIDEAMKLREAYSKNVGTILVGINEDHIIAAMGDDRIDFIIPFHKSGWSKREMGLITEMASYKDHTRWQNEKKIESVSKDGKIKTIPNKKSKITNLAPVGPNNTGYWDFKTTGQQNAEHYLELCKEDGRVPKFSQFLVNNGDGSFSLPQGNDKRSENIRKGYWKLLIDFKMYDNAGKGSPQTEVTPNFNMKQAMDIMKTYDGPTNELPTNHKLAQKFAEEYKAEHPRKSYSIKNPGDLDVNQWMKTVTPGMLRTPAERKLVADYRGLRTKIELETKKQSDYKNKLAVLEAKDDPTQSEKRQAEGLRVRIRNSQAIQQDYENKLYEITGSEGYATMMYNQSKIMESFLNGKTEAQVRDSVEAMQRQNAEAQKKIDKLSAELKELAGSKEVRRVRALMNQDKLNELAKKLRTDYNSTIDRQELTDELAMIRLKMQRGQDATADVENLAGRIVNDMQPDADPTLTQMRGMTIQVTQEQLKELKGRGESMTTIRSKLAGTGIKVEQGSVNTLVDNLSDLQERFGADLDFGGEKDALRNFADWVENRKQGSTETREQYRQNMADVMSDVYGAIAQVELNLPKDKATRDQFEQLFRYVEEVAKQAEKGAEIMDGMKTAMREAIESGKSAAAWTESLRNDVDATIDYFNKTAQLAEETAQSRHVQQVIEQLKSKHVEEMIKRNEQWRNMIERDRNARIQNEANNAKRRIITTDATRLMKLLVSPKGEKVVPEHMNGMARKLIELLVDNDLLGGRKITDIEKRNLFEYKRILNGWNQRDGRFNIDDLQLGDDNLTELVKEDLAYIEDKLKEWNDRYYGKNKLDTLEKRGSTLEQLQEAISEIYSVIKQEQSIEIGDRRVLVADQAYKVQQAIAGRKFREWNGKAGKVIAALHKGIVSGNMTPEYFFRTLRNEGMWDLWEEYHKAENRNGLELARSKNRLAEIAEKHGYRKWDMGKRMTLEMANGDKVSMTIGQLMSLYATWNREQQLGPEMSNHLKKGGFFVDESDPNRGIISRVLNEKRAHRVTETDMDKVNGMLTEEQKQFVYDVVQYMSNEMSELGNEASMKAYGIKMYKEKYYFPFKIWDGVKSRKSNDAGNGANIDRAFHPSFSKARTHNAGNALILGDFMQTAADHIAGMINYATMGLANETLQKVLNFREQQDGSEDGEGATARNIRAMLEEAYGRTAMNYLEDLKTQLNGGAVRIERTFYDKLISLFRKNAVAGSLSVAAQQPLSFIRAAMLIDPKYLARALAPDMWRGSYKEMMEHSGVAVIKEMGRFDMNAGQSAREYLMPDGFKGKGQAAYDKAVELATMLPERMDRMTWTRMWSAVKAEQMAQNPKMDPKSEAFLNKVAVRFNEVMRRTQVYDSVLVRSRNMRNPNPAVKGITSFMAEPTLTLNVLADSVRMAIQGEKGGKAMAAKAGATFLISGVLQAVIKALFSSGRTPDEKKTLLENILYRLESNLVSELNPLSMIPGYSDFVNVLENGKIEDDALGVIGKIISAGETAVDILLGKSDKSAHRAIEDSAGQLVQIFTGVPLKNIMRDGRAIYNWISGAPYADRPTNPNVLKYQGEAAFWNSDTILGAINARLGEAGFETKNTAYYERIYEAKKAGNEQLAGELTDYLMTAKGVKGNTITSGVKAAAKADESATVSERAGIISSAGADPNDYVLDLVKGGKLGEGEALKILKEQNPDTDENDLWWKVDRAAYYRDTGRSAGSGEYYRFHDAIEANDTKAIRAAVGDLTAHGKTNAQIRTNIKSQYKEKYLKLQNGKQKIALKNALIMAYKATGMTEAEAEATINGWK